MANFKKGEIVRLINEDYIGSELYIVDIKDNLAMLKYVNGGEYGFPTCLIQTNIDKIYKV